MTAAKQPRRKISLIDMHVINRAVEVAAFAVDPDEYTYRTVFRKEMPKLYVMRARGLSFPQIHWRLQQGGFPIALTTLRTCYYECLPGMLDECQKYLKKLGKVAAEADQAVTLADRTPGPQAAASRSDSGYRQATASQISTMTTSLGAAPGGLDGSCIDVIA
jgi:hypothetical protein